MLSFEGKEKRGIVYFLEVARQSKDDRVTLVLGPGFQSVEIRGLFSPWTTSMNPAKRFPSAKAFWKGTPPQIDTDYRREIDAALHWSYRGNP